MTRCVTFLVYALAGFALLASCSTGPTLTDYAEGMEALATEMDAELRAVAADVSTAEPTHDAVLALVDEQVAIVSEFVAGFRSLEPPADAEELHVTALRVLDRWLSALQAIAAEVASAANLEGSESIFETLARIEQSGVMAELVAADEDVLAICKAAQQRFDATQEEALAAGTPWVPAELKEVVRVTLSCDTDSG